MKTIKVEASLLILNTIVAAIFLAGCIGAVMMVVSLIRLNY